LGDIARTGKEQVLQEAVSGCDAILSVSGTSRLSRFTDFLPWRLFRDASKWTEDTSHPYYANYKAQCMLVDCAKKDKGVSRFVRLTGLSTGYSAFHPVSVIFSAILSMTSRYHFLMEEYLRHSGLPYVILRPGGLMEEDRVSLMVWVNILSHLSNTHTYLPFHTERLHTPPPSNQFHG